MVKVATEFGGVGCRVEWTRVGPSGDTLQRVLPLLLERLEPEGAVKLFQVCKPLPSLPPLEWDAHRPRCQPGSRVVLVGLVDPWFDG